MAVGFLARYAMNIILLCTSAYLLWHYLESCLPAWTCTGFTIKSPNALDGKNSKNKHPEKLKLQNAPMVPRDMMPSLATIWAVLTLKLIDIISTFSNIFQFPLPP